MAILFAMYETQVGHRKRNPSGRAPRVYVDFDDVLCETARTLLDLLAREFGKHHTFESIISFDLDTSFGLSPYEYAAFMRRVHTPEIMGGIPPMPGAVETLKAWSTSGVEIMIVTGRPAETDAICREWLGRHGLSEVGLMFVDKYDREQLPASAAPVHRRESVIGMDFDLAVEDAPSMLGFLVEKTRIPVAILDRPWNRKLTFSSSRPNVHRCHDWHEIGAAYSACIST